jgi:hypothetical protein
MPLNMRDPNADSSSGATRPAHSYPIARSYALTVLAALAGLFLLHHLVFNVAVSGGVK